MEWTEQQTKTRETMTVDEARAKLLNEVKRESLPVIQNEVKRGDRPFEKVEFQPIKGVGTFEAEFGVKGDDIIYHVWPYGYHDADRTPDQRLPAFRKGFDTILSYVMDTVFGKGRCEISFDADIGAWFIKARGHGSSQFHRNMCIEAATALHKALGGSEG